MKRLADPLGQTIYSARPAHCSRPPRIGRATPLALTRPAATSRPGTDTHRPSGSLIDELEEAGQFAWATTSLSRLRQLDDSTIESTDRGPKLRDVRWFANPDPRVKANSPALKAEQGEALEAPGGRGGRGSGRPTARQTGPQRHLRQRAELARGVDCLRIQVRL